MARIGSIALRHSSQSTHSSQNIMIRQRLFRPVTSATSRLLSTPIPRATSFISVRCFSTETTTTAGAAAPPSPPSAPNAVKKQASAETASPGSKSTESSSASTASTPEPLKVYLQYSVERTRSMNFPVYDDSKSGGTNKFTQVRKIVGKHQVLKRDLISELGYKKEYVNINPVTGHINIKGHHSAEIKKWLAARGF